MIATEATKANMAAKLQWATNCYNRIKALPDNSDSEVREEFWAYLQAIQQIWFYYGAWLKANGLPKKAGLFFDIWKTRFLSTEETVCIESLNLLRNEDTHTGPVDAKFDIIVEIRSSNGFYVGATLTAETIKEYFIHIEGREYKLFYLCEQGLHIYQQFLNSFMNIDYSVY